MVCSIQDPKKVFKIDYDGKTIKYSRVTNENTKMP